MDVAGCGRGNAASPESVKISAFSAGLREAKGGDDEFVKRRAGSNLSTNKMDWKRPK